MILSIIIVNYNVKFFLEQCLQSVTAACGGLDAEIIVIDNHSFDGSREYLSGKFTKVLFHWNETNKGFAAANNQGIQKARGEYFLLLNPDTIVPEDAFIKCLEFAKKQEKFGAIGVHMIDGSGKFLRESKRSFPSVKASMFKMAGLTSSFPGSKFFSSYYATHLSEKESGVVAVLPGAFLMFSRQALHLTQGLDEDFFMYGEDIDFSFRIFQSGLKNFYYADVSIIHFKGESSVQHTARYLNNFHEAMKLFVKKHYQQKKITSAFLMQAISLAGLLAKLKSKTSSRKNQTCIIRAVVICRAENLSGIVMILKNANPVMEITGNIEPAPAKKMYFLLAGKIHHGSNTIIFDGTHMEVSDMILCMKEFPGLGYLFRLKGTNVIVGSPSKNQAGMVIQAG